MGSGSLLQIVLGYLFPFLVVPLVGAGLLLVAFRLSGNRDATFRQCWWAYLAAFVYGFFLVALVGYFIHWHTIAPWKSLAVCAAVTWATHAVAVPLITRRRGRRDLLAQEGAILVANLVFTAGMFVFLLGQ